MSLKGNVAGLGLGELLQSLVRGGRDGALTLYGDGLHAVVGFQDSLIYLLPGEDERDDLWTIRCRDAWADDHNGAVQPHLQAERCSTIARAERLETLYRMLESSNLHFSFRPGNLSQFRHAAVSAPTDGEDDGALAVDLSIQSPVPAGDQEDWGPGLAVEHLLLEFARLADHLSNDYGAALIADDVPRALDVGSCAPEYQDFISNCDGNSSIREIADRFGWALRQGYVAIVDQLRTGNVRLSTPHELLSAAKREMDHSHTARAASRFVAWIRTDAAGPLSANDAEFLVAEWEAGRLGLVLQGMPPTEARMLLRRLDLVHQDRRAMIERWGALYETHRGDLAIALHLLALRSAEAEVSGHAPVAELLRLARAFREKGQRSRARVTLRMAGTLRPKRLSHRLELGNRMLEMGLYDEGGAWLLDVAREQIAAQQGDKALTHVRKVLDVCPDHSEARTLLAQARQHSSSSRKRRRNSLVGLAVVLLFSGLALVQVRQRQLLDEKLSEVTGILNNPEEALALLDHHFPDSDARRVLSLRASLQQRIKDDQRVEREAWLKEYEAIRNEIAERDPIQGLKHALELAEAPAHAKEIPTWPTRAELYGQVTKRFVLEAQEVDYPVDGTLEERHAEEALIADLEHAIAVMDKHASGRDKQVGLMAAATRGLLADVLDRREQREKELAEQQLRQLEEQLDILLGAARAHQSAGDVVRSFEAYERFMSLDQDGEITEILGPELYKARKHYESFVEAQERSFAGDHEGALAILKQFDDVGDPVCPDPSEHPLPWRVTSEPTGAVAHFPDGAVRKTPFTLYSAFGERVEMTFAYPGSEDRSFRIEEPADLLVRMHQVPDRHWDTPDKVEALPVPVGNDHVLADRKGRVGRFDRDGVFVWEREFSTLGGIAHEPVFLPGREGHLLLVAEDGKAWVVDAETGADEGPWAAGSVLVEGPVVQNRKVLARFRDGSIAEWSFGPEPVVFTPEESFVDQSTGPNGSLFLQDPDVEVKVVALRRSASAGSALPSPWTEWIVEVYDDEYLVKRTGSSPHSFSASRSGDWHYLAWEKPSSRIPLGRLWVADGKGLRSFLPAEK